MIAAHVQWGSASYHGRMTSSGAAAPLREISLGTQDFGWALGTLLRTYLRGIEEVVEALPGGPRAYQVMTIVAAGTCQNQAAIAERLGIDRTITTHLVDGLEAQKLVRRSPDPLDRRSRRITLTPRGQKRLRTLTEGAKQVEEALLASLSHEAADVLRASLHAAAEAVGGGSTEGVCRIAEEVGAAVVDDGGF